MKANLKKNKSMGSFGDALINIKLLNNEKAQTFIEEEGDITFRAKNEKLRDQIDEAKIQSQAEKFV